VGQPQWARRRAASRRHAESAGSWLPSRIRSSAVSGAGSRPFVLWRIRRGGGGRVDNRVPRPKTARGRPTARGPGERPGIRVPGEPGRSRRRGTVGGGSVVVSPSQTAGGIHVDGLARRDPCDGGREADDARESDKFRPSRGTSRAALRGNRWSSGRERWLAGAGSGCWRPGDDTAVAPTGQFGAAPKHVPATAATVGKGSEASRPNSAVQPAGRPLRFPGPLAVATRRASS
jgi:hypothetical protein